MTFAAAEQQDIRLAVDIGGTFTDVAIDVGESYVTAKTPTTPGEFARGAIEGIRDALQRAVLEPGDVWSVIHGTTVATNALIEHKGAKVGAIMTAGFRDVLEIAYERRYDQYDLLIDKPDMLVSRDRCYTVPERVAADGQVLEPLDEDAVEEITAEIEREGIESVAVGLLHSYANEEHERRLRELLQARLPYLWVSLSSEVSPEIREYDRLCTTVANAYIRPLMARYLQDFEHALRQEGFECPLFVITSAGGMTTLDTATRFPIRLVESGPSGGAILAAKIARQLEADEVVSFDMGGTTAKVCLIDNGEPDSSRVFEIARAARFIKGSGLPVRIPVIEMIEIGAGGGSIASVDKIGRIAIGPESASADPGPASYGRGGDRPTVTDADTVLGYLDPDAFAGGSLTLDRELAREAIAEDVAQPLALQVEAGAQGISRMVEENMANAARIHAVERGGRLETRALIAFGGNGPLYATRLAEKIGVNRIIIPRDQGVGSAVGFLSAPVSYEIVRSYYTRLAEFEPSTLNELLEATEREAASIVRQAAPDGALEVRRLASMRYVGQGHEIEIPVPARRLNAADADFLRDSYETRYAELYGRHVPDMEIEIINWTLVVSTEARPAPARPNGVERRSAVAGHYRSAQVGQSDEIADIPCFERSALAPGDELEGPAFIVETQTTTYVSPEFDAAVDSIGNIMLTRRVEVGG